MFVRKKGKSSRRSEQIDVGRCNPFNCFVPRSSQTKLETRIPFYYRFILCDKVSVSLAPPLVGFPPPLLAKVCFPWILRTCRVPMISLRSHRWRCFCCGCVWSLWKSEHFIVRNPLNNQLPAPCLIPNSHKQTFGILYFYNVVNFFISKKLSWTNRNNVKDDVTAVLNITAFFPVTYSYVE